MAGGRSNSGDAPDGAQAGIQSVEVALQLLTQMGELAAGASPPMLKTLAEAAGMAPAKVHRYMVSMVRAGYVERDPATARYRLGPMARQIGINALCRTDVVRIAGARLPQICALLQQSVALAIWTHNGPTVVATEDLRRPVTVGTRVGEVMPLLASATGRVFSAWMPRPLIEPLLALEWAALRTGKPVAGVRSAKDFERLLEQVRAAGVAWTLGGMSPNVNALAAPVFDYRGVFAGALAMLGPADSLDASPGGADAGALRAAADAISRDAGFAA